MKIRIIKKYLSVKRQFEKEFSKSLNQYNKYILIVPYVKNFEREVLIKAINRFVKQYDIFYLEIGLSDTVAADFTDVQCETKVIGMQEIVVKDMIKMNMIYPLCDNVKFIAGREINGRYFDETRSYEDLCSVILS